jgi:hypothetical protein
MKNLLISAVNTATCEPFGLAHRASVCVVEVGYTSYGTRL